MPNLKGDSSTYVRATSILVLFLGILSIVELGLCIKDGLDLHKEPVDAFFSRHYGGKVPTGAQIAFYSATAAFISVIYTPFDAYNYIRFSRRQLFSLIGSVVLTLMWICQIGFWTNCEALVPDDGGVQPWCPQFAMANRQDRSVLNTPVQRAKFVLGYITAFTWLGYMIVCAVAIHKTRKATKPST